MAGVPYRHPLTQALVGSGSVAERYQTWPEKLARTVWGGFTLPGDVYVGRVDPLSQEGIERSADLAGALTLGSGALPAAANEARMGIKAYHGSPHDFDKFSMEKIGTGEGAQAYGHGMYFAENEGVAKSYKEALGGDVLVRGQKVGSLLSTPEMPLRPVDRSALQAIQLTNGDNTLAYVDDLISKGKQPAELREVTEQWLKDVDRVAGGRTYEVEINASPDEFLDWDKPLSEQPKIFAKLKELGLPEKEWTGQGADGYYGLTDSEADATAALRAAGIKGIRYKDAGSRNAGGWHITPPAQTTSGKWMVKSSDYNSRGLHFDTEAEAKVALAKKTAGETHNYVVFDENIISILKKYGIAGLSIGAAGGSMTGSGEAQATPANGLYGVGR